MTVEESVLIEPGTISYDPRWDYMSCSCGNTDRLDGFDSLSDLSCLGRFRLFILDWLVRLKIVPAESPQPSSHVPPAALSTA